MMILIVKYGYLVQDYDVEVNNFQYDDDVKVQFKWIMMVVIVNGETNNKRSITIKL